MAHIEHLDLARGESVCKKTNPRKRTLSCSNMHPETEKNLNIWLRVQSKSLDDHCSICSEHINGELCILIPTCCKQITCNDCYQKINQSMCPYCRTEFDVLPPHILKNIEQNKADLKQAEIAAEPDIRIELIRAERTANGECCCEICIERYLDYLKADEAERELLFARRNQVLGPEADLELDRMIAEIEENNQANRNPNDGMPELEADHDDQSDQDDMPELEEPLQVEQDDLPELEELPEPEILSNWISIQTPVRCASCFETTIPGVNAWVSSCCSNGVDGNPPNGYCIDCFPQIDPNISRCVTCNNPTRSHDVHQCNCISCQSNLQIETYQAMLAEDDELAIDHPNKLSEDERIYFQILIADAQAIINQNVANHFYRIIQNNIIPININPNNINPNLIDQNIINQNIINPVNIEDDWGINEWNNANIENID
jgi:hypothetical protein